MQQQIIDALSTTLVGIAFIVGALAVTWSYLTRPSARRYMLPSAAANAFFSLPICILIGGGAITYGFVTNALVAGGITLITLVIAPFAIWRGLRWSRQKEAEWAATIPPQSTI